MTLKNYETRGYGMFAVEHLETGAVIGIAGLVHPGGQETPELKYAYVRDYWGQGYATEAGRALVEWGAAEFEMTRIIATTSPENAPSHRVLAKCGMVDEGVEEVDGESVQTFVWTAATAS
ncbi:MAG: GNAT family N-acetyltransferase [Planctomycetota bacterium]